MRTVTLILVLSLCSAIDCWYKPYIVIPGHTARIKCLEHVKGLDEASPRLYYRWFYNGKPLDPSKHPDKWLDDQNRTLVVDNVNKYNVGKYACECRMLRDGKRCLISRKRSNAVQRTALEMMTPVRSGFCHWTDNRMNSKEKVSYLKQKYSFMCKCENGDEWHCGVKMKIQRQDRETKDWIDVDFGVRHGAVSFEFHPRVMQIIGVGSNLTFEESGWHRCVSYDEKGIICESRENKLISHDFDPIPLPSAIADHEHLLKYGVPLLAITVLTLTVLSGMILYYRCTSRIVVQAKNTSLIGKIVPTAPEVGTSQQSDSSSQSGISSSSLYPDLENISTIA